ncbi:MAG: UvrD-helicase domain-containing protein [Pseudomonadota bacterium]
MTPVPDAAVRERALDPRLCCIVQAPAGSGKTELLIQRMLVLLAEVERPEEILSITFTRKAAGEMRTRVLRALREAGQPLAEDAPPHLVRQRARARAALARDRQQGWNLLAQPARLRIQTIDGLCAGLAARLPLSARLGAQATIAEHADELYREAAARVLERIEDAPDNQDQGGGEAAALEILLAHLGNDLERVRGLLAAMLGKRDQWARHVLARAPGQGAQVAASVRMALEDAVRRMIEDELRALGVLFPSALRDETRGVAAILCAHLMDIEVAPDDRRLLWDVPGWPASGADGLARWQGLADLLLTKDGDWRKSMNSSNGVPAPSEKGIDKDAKAARTAFKQRVGELLDALRGHPDLAPALHATRAMPEVSYRDGDWAVLEALIDLLRLALAELTVLFAARGEVDFVETAQGALRALGEPDAPSDLLLAFDYRIRHILIDEFQDTSHTQFELLERLLAGWQPGVEPFREAEGRSLFLVGDPMQSIYRFREAEVGLFLRAQREGVACGGGQLRLDALTLSTNFRSQAGIVEWVNEVFPKVLAERENIAEGAVPYTPSQAHHPRAGGEAVGFHLFPVRRDEDAARAPPERGAREAARVVECVRAALAEIEADAALKPVDCSVAILVRTRGHLVRILPVLRAAGIPFQAVEIEQLAAQPMVQDLLALTRALLHPADRIAWLAVLRAPWCGLSLADLHALVEGVPGVLWQAMHDDARLAHLSEEGRARLSRLRTVLARALADGGRVSLRRQVEGAWLALGGGACARGGEADAGRERDEARIFFDLLDSLGAECDATTLEESLARLYAPPEGEARVQVMTIHKSKGLQFHTVILPGLARVPRREDSQLLLWLERETRTSGEADLLLAPIRGLGETEAPLYRWIAAVQQARGAYEDGRLLYVAATRAIRRLHLLAETGLDKDGRWSPPKASLLGRLWPGIEARVGEPPDAPDDMDSASLPARTGPDQSGPDRAASDVAGEPLGLRRLPVAWQAPAPPVGVRVRRAETRTPSAKSGAVPDDASAGPEATLGWDDGDALPRHVGVLVHRLLERIALDKTEAWDGSRLRALSPALRRQLHQAGVEAERLDEGLERVLRALENTLADERGRWILAPHDEARCEWALDARLEGVTIGAVIDRTFISEGERWIIDYKTAEPAQGEGVEAFLDRQQAQYCGQLESYAGLLRRLEPERPVRLGLYFPLLSAWRAWHG